QAALGAEVERDRALAPVEVFPVEAAALVQRPAVGVDAAAERVDADDVGAHRGEGGPAQRSRDEGGELDDPQAAQDAVHQAQSIADREIRPGATSRPRSTCRPPRGWG